MERHVYKFEFKYDRQVNGKKTDFTVPVIVHDECYVDACTKVDEFVRKNFADRVTEESTIKYVGEFVHGVLKPFVEEVKEEEYMRMGKSKKELVNLNKGLMIDVDVQKNVIKTLKQRCENNQQKIEDLIKKRTRVYADRKYLEGVCDNQQEEIDDKTEQIESLQKRISEYEAKESYKGGFTFVQGSRGSGKKEIEKQRLMLNGFMYTDNTLDDIIEKIKNTQPQIFDVNSLYPQAVDVCKVYQIERDQALKENEALKKRIEFVTSDSDKVYANLRFADKECARLMLENGKYKTINSGYKKELSQLNLLMDDMENRLEKQVVAREGMLKQLREYKAEKKRMNKIIDALTEVEK